MRGEVGVSTRTSPSIGDERAVRRGARRARASRASRSTRASSTPSSRARGATSSRPGSPALLTALVLAVAFARTVSRPVDELRDVARALAAGDLSRRPALSAPGELGDLADAVHRMAEQLEARLAALQADDALMAALIDSLQEGVAAVDARRQVVILNEPARRLLGIAERVPFPADLLPRDAVAPRRARRRLRRRELGADGDHARRPHRDAHRAAPPRRRRGARLLDLTHDPPPRGGAPRLRRQRLARAQDAAHGHRRLRRDARHHDPGGRAAPPVRRSDPRQRAAHAAARRRPARSLAHRVRRLDAEAGARGPPRRSPRRSPPRSRGRPPNGR